MIRSSVLFSIALGVSVASGAFAHVGDVGLKVVGGRIHTGLVDDSGGSQIVIPGERVFGAELGLSIPGFGDEPGFFASEGEFAAGSSLSFNVRRAVRTWDAANGNFLTFGPERLRIEDPAQTAFLDTPVSDPADPIALPFGLAVPGAGDFDDHPFYTVLGRTTEGIYLLEVEMTTSIPGIGKSDPFWLVLNDGASEQQHDLAIEWVQNNVLPTPGSLGAFGVAAVMIGRRRRR